MIDYIPVQPNEHQCVLYIVVGDYCTYVLYVYVRLVLHVS